MGIISTLGTSPETGLIILNTINQVSQIHYKI